MDRRDTLRRLLATGAAGAGLVHAPLQAAGCRSESPAGTVALVELFTSEGCSSCPPADRWLSRVSAGDPARIAPLSLHVRYWDHIGWKDPFAQTAFGERQRWLTAAGGGRTVYTPGVYLAGREWRGWDDPVALERRLAELQRRPAGARIAIAVDGPADAPVLKVSAALAPGATARRPALYVALTRSGLQSAVDAGENRGATLRHDHVALRLDGPLALDAEGRAAYSAPLAATGGAPARFGVTAFVQDLADAGIVQAWSMALPARCVRAAA
ncbi:MAG: DUF1223 domain-containing protein [Burkholderiales bacterium]|nr:MAG: DUF1223 domain-containing protein [Burkholderiales bacterium]